MLVVENLSIRYANATVVDEVDFAIEAGESLGIVGESGSGKTQTALAILGLLPGNATVSGSIQLGGTELLGAGEAELNSVRATRVAMVFQDPMQALNPFVTISAQLQRILLQHRLAAGAEAKRRVVEMLERVQLPDAKRRLRAYPHELSGGMRQRVMIASALIANPELLIADEPTTALDVTVQAQILELLEELRDDTALLLITHDLGVVAEHCERMLVMQGGKLVEEGHTAEVFASPRNEHTRALLRAAPRIDAIEAPAAVDADVVFEVESADVSYRLRQGELHAVRSIDLAVARGEALGIVGESGSGKSSAVRAALGLVAMQSGRVVWCGETLEGPAQARSKASQRGVQLVFQDPIGSLNPQMRVADIVAEPLRVHEAELSAENVHERCLTMLKKVGLGEKYLERYPHELSGGQAQRVAIARALILEPSVLVCDEAVAALDGTVRQQVLELLRKLQRDTGLAIIFISHDLAVVRVISHRVLVMYLGRVVELADNQTLFSRPRHPYTRALLDAIPIPDPTRARRRAMLQGEVPSALQPPAGCAFHPRCPFAEAVCENEVPVSRDLDGTMVACHRAAEI